MNSRKSYFVENEEIIITHFINPNSFYYRYVDKAKDDELLLLDEVVGEAVESAKQEKRYVVGQMVIVEYLPQNKYLRGIIDGIKTDYIVWALDYGFPIKTPAKHIYRMNKHLQTLDVNYVHFAGISNVIPAKEIFDYSKGKANVIGEKSWNEISMSLMTKFLKEFRAIRFVSNRKIQIGDRYQFLGDLELCESSKKSVSFKRYLLEKVFAIEIPEDQFEFTMKRIRTNAIVRWKNYALVECCQLNEIPKNYPSKQSSEASDQEKDFLSRTQIDYEDDDDESIELNEKISDWNFRNELESRNKKHVTIVDDSSDRLIDDIEFDDSASCAPSVLKSSSWMKKTRSIADVRKKYGDILPPPPSSEENSVTVSNVVKQKTSQVSMRTRHLEIFKKVQEKQAQQEAEETVAASMKSKEKQFKESVENVRSQDIENLWNIDGEKVSIF